MSDRLGQQEYWKNTFEGVSPFECQHPYGYGDLHSYLFANDVESNTCFQNQDVTLPEDMSFSRPAWNGPASYSEWPQSQQFDDLHNFQGSRLIDRLTQSGHTGSWSENQSTQNRFPSPSVTNTSMSPLSGIKPEATPEPDFARHPGTSTRRAPRTKQPYNPQKRREVAEVRSIGCCLNCKVLRRKCDQGTPCDRCEHKFGDHLRAQPYCIRQTLSVIRFSSIDLFRTKYYKDLSEKTKATHGYEYVSSSSLSCCETIASQNVTTFASTGIGDVEDLYTSFEEVCSFHSRNTIPPPNDFFCPGDPALEVFFQKFSISSHQGLTGPFARLHRAIADFRDKCDKNARYIDFKDPLLAESLSLNRTISDYHNAVSSTSTSNSQAASRRNLVPSMASSSWQEQLYGSTTGMASFGNEYLQTPSQPHNLPQSRSIYDNSSYGPLHNNLSSTTTAQNPFKNKFENGEKAVLLERLVVRELEDRILKYKPQADSRSAGWSIANPLSTWLCIWILLLSYREHMDLILYFHHDDEEVCEPLHTVAKRMYHALTIVYAAYFRRENPLASDWDNADVRRELGNNQELLESFWNIKKEMLLFYQEKDRLSQHDSLFKKLIIERDGRLFQQE